MSEGRAVEDKLKVSGNSGVGVGGGGTVPQLPAVSQHLLQQGCESGGLQVVRSRAVPALWCGSGAWHLQGWVHCSAATRSSTTPLHKDCAALGTRGARDWVG